MTEPGFVAKLVRAIALYETIHEESGTLIEGKFFYKVTPRRIGDDEWDILTWNKDVEGRPGIGVLVGELVHDVRSALDHLIYSLVAANDCDPGEHTQFPIYDSETLWIRDIEERDPDRKPSPVHGLRPDQLALVKKAQPYHLTKKKRAADPLMKLLRMSNVDKHQNLHTSAVKAHAPASVAYEPYGYIAVMKKQFAKPGTLCKKGTEFGRVKRRIIQRPPPGTEVKMRIKGIAEMVFSEPGRDPIASLDEVGKMILAARDVVLDLRPDLAIPELPTLDPD